MKYLIYLLIVLLLLCLAPMPYGYYVFVRWETMVLFAMMAYNYWEKNKNLSIVFVGLALLFQPFMKVALGRTIWNVVDVLVAISLIFIVMKRHRE